MPGFEDFMKIVEGGQEKTASVKKVDNRLLTKLAAEMEASAAAPTAEGQVANADASVASAPAVPAAQTDAVAVPQEVAAGADPAEKPAGEMPAPTKPNEGVVVSAGDGKITDEVDGKMSDAKAEAEKSTGETEQAKHASVATPIEKTAEEVEADKIGRIMAHAYADEMQKIAFEQEYVQSVGILKEAGLLDEYKIEVPEIEKTASTNGLEKIAQKQALTKEDIVSAATELMQKVAEAEEAGREAAQADAAAAEEAPAAEAPAAEAEKTAAFSDEVKNAISVLKAAKVIG